jgi:hypothetical protein
VIDVRIHPRRVTAVGLLALTGAALSPVVADAKPKPPGEEGATHGRTSCSILTPGIEAGIAPANGR